MQGGAEKHRVLGRGPVSLAAILEPARAAGVIPATAIADGDPSNLATLGGGLVGQQA